MDDGELTLPYGDAFRFVDEVVSSDAAGGIVTRTDYATRADLVGAHGVAGAAVVPGVLLAEQAAQSAYLLGREMSWLGPEDRALLGRLNCTFDRPVAAGVRVEAHVTAQVVGGDVAGFRAELRVDDQLVARIIVAVKNLGPVDS